MYGKPGYDMDECRRPARRHDKLGYAAGFQPGRRNRSECAMLSDAVNFASGTLSLLLAIRERESVL